MPKFLKPAPAQGGMPAGARTFRRDWAVVYYGMRSPRSPPHKSAPFAQIWHRQTKPAAAPRRAAQITPRPLPTSGTRLGMDTQGVQSARYGPTQPKMGVVGCRLWLLAPLRARGKAPSGQVSNSREVPSHGCSDHAAHDSRREYAPACEPSDRPNLPCFMHAGSMSRASRKRT